jgi:hypothetical protein
MQADGSHTRFLNGHIGGILGSHLFCLIQRHRFSGFGKPIQGTTGLAQGSSHERGNFVPKLPSRNSLPNCPVETACDVNFRINAC